MRKAREAEKRTIVGFFYKSDFRFINNHSHHTAYPYCNLDNRTHREDG